MRIISVKKLAICGGGVINDVLGVVINLQLYLRRNAMYDNIWLPSVDSHDVVGEAGNLIGKLELKTRP